MRRQTQQGNYPGVISLTPGFNPVWNARFLWAYRFNGLGQAEKPLKRLKLSLTPSPTGLKPGVNETTQSAFPILPSEKTTSHFTKLNVRHEFHEFTRIEKAFVKIREIRV